MIYLIISFLLDNALSAIIGNSYQHISYFFPIIFVSSIPIIYSLIKNKKVTLILLIIIGIIYDTLYSDIFLINTYYFILYYLFLYIFYSNRKVKLFNIVIVSILGFIFYDIFIFFILMFLHYDYFTISYLGYKIVHSLIINIIYIIISIYFLKSRIFGFEKKQQNY